MRWSCIAFAWIACLAPFQEARAQPACPGLDVGMATAALAAASGSANGSVLTGLEILLESFGEAVIRRASVGDGGQADQFCSDPDISGDGGIVVFETRSQNLVTPPTANRNHVFARPLCGPTRLVSATEFGVEGNALSGEPVVSADGGTIVFDSNADNLIGGESPFGGRIYISEAGVITRMDLRPANQSVGDRLPSVSADGRFIAYETSTTYDPDDVPNSADIYVRDRMMGTNVLVSRNSEGNHAGGDANDISDASISDNGRYVAFLSDKGLVPEDPGGTTQVYVRDWFLGTTTLATIGFDGFPANKDCDSVKISPDGRFVVFHTTANNLLPVAVSSTNVYLRDLDADFGAGATERINVGFSSEASTWNGRVPDVSDGGRYVVFASTSPLDGVGNSANQIYARDRMLGETRLVSKNVLGQLGGTSSGGGTDSIVISSDGSWIAFTSLATNLVGGDTNGIQDIFVAPNPFVFL